MIGRFIATIEIEIWQDLSLPLMTEKEIFDVVASEANGGNFKICNVQQTGEIKECE